MKIPETLVNRTAEGNRRPPKPIVAAGAVSLLAFILLQSLPSQGVVQNTAEMIEAASIMERATVATREFCDSSGVEIDETVDPNRTCLIGPELTPLMTTLGHLDAKRTTTDPTMASLVVYLLERAGVKSGDTIAVGSSASFPGLLIATVAASEAMGVHPIVAISLGASTYGATRPNFNLLDIYALLLRKGVVETPLAAVSMGGDEDVGSGFDEDTKAEILEQIAAAGVHLITEPNLRSNVAERMRIYGRVSAFVNTGGSYANLGTSQLALRLEPGLNTGVELPPEEQRGVLFEMVSRDIPVIHLLFIRGLVRRYGTTWDPIPLPEPGDIELYTNQSGESSAVWLIGVPYLLAVTILVASHVRTSHRLSHPAG